MIAGGQTNLNSATDVNVELKSGMTDGPDPFMDPGASVDPSTRAASPTTAVFHLQSLQSLSKDDKENFTAEQVDEFRPRYQRSPRLLRTGSVTHRDHKQAKKEFSTQREPKRTACWTICLGWFIWLIFRWPWPSSSRSEKGQKAPEGELGPLLLTWLHLIPAWISNYIHYNVWDEITYPFLNFSGATVEV